MKKTVGILSFCLMFSIFCFFSCLDPDYDLDSEKLDPNISFSDKGMNIPIGSIKKISVYEELKRNYTGDLGFVGADANDVIYIQYDGSFNIEFPEYETTIEPVSTEANVVLDGIPAVMGTAVPLQEGRTYHLIPVTTAEMNDISSMVHQSGGENVSDWNIDIQSITFESFMLAVTLDFKGLNLTGNNAILTVELQFSNQFTIAGESQNKIRRNIPINSMTSGTTCTISGIPVEKFEKSSDPATFTYQIDLVVNSSGAMIQLNQENPSMDLRIYSPSEIIPNTLKAAVTGAAVLENTVDGFPELGDTFDRTENVLNFKNPVLVIDSKSSVGCNFSITLDEVYGDHNDLLISDPTPFFFEKNQSTAYILCPSPQSVGPNEFPQYPGAVLHPFDLDQIVNNLPDQLAYKVKVDFYDPHAEITNHQKWSLDANYSVRLPFDFTAVDFTLRDTITDLFDASTYESVFEYTDGSISIEADTVDISFSDKLNLDLKAHILDEQNQILISFDPVLIPDPDNASNHRLVITIRKADIPKMETARHLEFVFTLKNKSGQEPDITTEDYINIRGLRLVSDGGIHYEL